MCGPGTEIQSDQMAMVESLYGHLVYNRSSILYPWE